MRSKERRRSSYGRLQVTSKLHVDNTTRDSKQNAQRRLVFNNSGSENDKVEIYNLKHKPQDVASIQYIAEDLQLFSKVLQFLTVQDNCRLACAGRKIVRRISKPFYRRKLWPMRKKLIYLVQNTLRQRLCYRHHHPTMSLPNQLKHHRRRTQ